MCIGAISSQLLLDIADFIYVAVDVNQKVTLINKKGCEVLGYSEDEIIGKNWFDNFLPKEVAEDIKSNFVKRIIENKETKLAKNYSILTKEGEERFISWHDTFFKDEKGNLIGVLCSGEDITEYSLTKKMLEANERKFREIFNHSNDGYLLRKLDGTILDVNPKFLELFGYNRDEIIGKNLKKIRVLEDNKELIRLIKKIGKEGFLQVEAEARKKDGTSFHIELNGITFDLEGEKVIFIIIRDLTERQKSESALRENEEKFRGLFESAAIGMAIVDLEGKLVVSNVSLQTMLGYTNTELSSMAFSEFTHPEDATIDTDLYMELQAGKREFYQIEKRYIKKNKDLIWVNLTATLIRDEKGEPLYGIGMAEDITQLKEARVALIESERKYKTLLESLPQRIFHKDINLIYVSCNENFAKDLNIQPSDIEGKTDFDFFISEHAEKYRAEDKRIMKEGKSVTIREKSLKNGKEYTSETTKIPLYDEKGDCIGVIGIYQDISERVKTDLALQESEEKYRSFVQNFKGIAFKRRLDFKPIFFHGAVEEITGYTEEEFVSGSFSWNKLIIPEDFEKMKVSVEKLKSVPNFVIQRDYRIIHKNGEIRWVHEIISNICDEKGKPVSVQGSIYDRTERKAIGEKIKESEEKYRTLFTEMKQAYALYEAVYDKKGDIKDAIFVEVNPEYEKLLNKKREEIIGKKVSEILPKLKKQEVNPIELLGRTALTGETVISEYFNKDLDKWLLAKSFSPMKNHTAILFEDITERHTLESALKKERETTKQYLDIANIILVGIDADEKVSLINKKGCELLGYEQDEIIGKNWFDNFLPKRTSKETKKVFQGLMVGNIERFENFENLILTKDGEERLIAWDNTYLEDEEGKIFGALASGKDITEIRKAQRELEESEKLSNIVLNHSYQLTGVMDPKGCLLKANNTALDFGGLKEKDVIGIPIWETYWWSHSIEEQNKLKIFIDRALKGETIQTEITNIDKDGDIQDLDFSLKPVKDDDGKIELILIEAQVVSEKRKLAKELIANELKFRSIFNHSNDGYILRTVEGIILEANPRFLEMFRVKRSEVISANIRSINTFTTPKSHIRRKREIKEKGFAQFETSARRRDGSIFPMEVNAVKLLLGEEELVFVIIRDITERKENEEKIKSSEAFYRALFDNTGTGMMLLEEDFTIKLVNNLLLEKSGISQGEFIGKNWTELIRIEERENIVKAIKRMGTDYIPPLTFETSDITIFGENKTTLVTIGTIPETKQSIVSLIDTTEQKELEKELRESEEKFRSIFDNAYDGISILEIDGTIIDINKSNLDRFGYEKTEVIGKKVSDLGRYVDPEFAEKILQNIIKEKHITVETIAKRKDDTLFHQELSLNMFKFGDKQFIIGISRDITERIEAEKELKSSEERLRNLFENLPIAISTNSSEGELIDVNLTYWKLFGYKNEEECLSTPFANCWFNIKDRERLYDSLRQKHYVQNFEIKLYKKDGSEFWGSITALTQIDASGERIHFTTIRDITTEKYKEDELKRQTLRYYLEESHLYLSEEERPYISKEAFSDLLRVGYNGLVLSRLPETEWKKDINYEFDFFRIAERGHLKTISSELSKIEQLIEELPNKHVIVIDRLDYLISKNGFETTLFFIFRLMDIAYLSNHIIILSIDPATIDDKERRLLRKEMRMIESIAESTLPEELLEILEFVHKKSITGDKPSYTDIVEAFSISRPTARKRIKELINEEYIFELTKGRSKVLEITGKGKATFD